MSNSVSLNSSSFDPATVATSLAMASTQSSQQLIDSQSQALQGTSQALSTLRSALSAFNSTLSGLSGLPGQGVTKYSATLADTTLGSATASASAVPGSYAVKVQQLATQHTIAFANLPGTAVPMPPAPASTIMITLANGQTGTVALSAMTGTMTAADIARAINQQANGLATATVVSGVDAGGNPVTQLTLTSGVSGAQGAISAIDFTSSGVTSAGTLVPGVSFASATELVAAQDAKATINGVAVQQGSNTLTAIPGVSLTLAQAQAPAAAPITLTVARNTSANATQVQNFVSAYNTLEATLDGLTAIGSNGKASGAFANDAGLRSLHDRLATTLRQTVNGRSLMNLGASADRSGSLSLDTTKLNNALAAQPTALDDVFGNASLAAPSGLLGSLSALTQQWTNPVKGQIQQRQQSVAVMSKSLGSQQLALTDRYHDAYNRYLAQFTQLQTLQSQMAQTLSMFG